MKARQNTIDGEHKINNEHNNFSNLIADQLITGDDRAEHGLINSIESRQSRVRTSTGEYWMSAAVGERPPLGSNIPFEGLYQQLVSDQHHHDRHSERCSKSDSSEASYSTLDITDVSKPPRIARSATTGGLKFAPRTFSSKSSNKDGQSNFNRKAPLRRHKRSSSRAQAFLDSIQDVSSSGTTVLSEAAILNGDFVKKNIDNSHQMTPTNDTQKHISSGNHGMTEVDELLVHALVDEHETIGDEVKMDYHHPSNPATRTEILDKTPTNKTKERTIEERTGNTVLGTKPSMLDIEAGEKVPLFPTSLSDNDISNNKNPRNISSSSLYDSCNDSIEGEKFITDASMQTTNSTIYIKKRIKRNKIGLLERIRHFFVDPWSFIRLLYHNVKEMHFLLASIPLFITALILYYYLGNPRFYFLPGVATLAWWLNFLGRQCITLEIARFIQWIVIDYIVLRTKLANMVLGPFLTLLLIQSRGWPFIVCMWSILDLLLLHGENPFQLHWLYFSNIRFYNEANSGSYVMVSGLYLRFLLSMLLSGLACMIKSSMVAIFFGRRTVSMFKERLENMLKEVVILAEVAELAAEASPLSTTDGEEVHLKTHPSKLTILANDYNWTDDRLSPKNDSSRGATADDERTESTEGTNENDLSPCSTDFEENTSKTYLVKDLLEKWEEPVNKMDKSMNTSIRDILKFRRALTFIDDAVLFGDAFGPASSRDQVLHSAEQVYRRLLKLCPDTENLSYEIFQLLIDEDDEKHVNEAKRKVMKRIFRPDANRELSLISFLQCCDTLYKNLRFLRASVGNASVIDKALERILNGIFYFFLVLTVLQVMHINPWPLLVSMSTILVSVSFAVSSSASHYIEGVLLVAVRRPYDLGDRIYMMDPSNINGDAIGMSWFIEDINLSYTTVRYAATNEVATLSNGSIAGLRIINANRSPNAVIMFQLPFHISIAVEKKEKLTELHNALDQYAKTLPNHWKRFLFCRVNELHVEREQAILNIGFQHQSSWQDVGRIMAAKADLICYVYELSKNLGVAYIDLPKREVLYHAGVLKNGSVKDYRLGLIDGENIKSQSQNSQVPGGANSFAPYATESSMAWSQNSIAN